MGGTFSAIKRAERCRLETREEPTMAQHTRDPGPTHQAFMAKLDDADREFAGRLSPTERLAIAAQFVGQLIAELPDGQYDPTDVMATVSGNMKAGNDHAAKGGSRSNGSGLLLS
jgi:hypothetical protein